MPHRPPQSYRQNLSICPELMSIIISSIMFPLTQQFLPFSFPVSSCTPIIIISKRPYLISQLHNSIQQYPINNIIIIMGQMCSPDEKYPTYQLKGVNVATFKTFQQKQFTQFLQLFIETKINEILIERYNQFLQAMEKIREKHTKTIQIKSYRQHQKYFSNLQEVLKGQMELTLDFVLQLEKEKRKLEQKIKPIDFKQFHTSLYGFKNPTNTGRMGEEEMKKSQVDYSNQKSDDLSFQQQQKLIQKIKELQSDLIARQKKYIDETTAHANKIRYLQGQLEKRDKEIFSLKKGDGTLQDIKEIYRQSVKDQLFPLSQVLYSDQEMDKKRQIIRSIFPSMIAKSKKIFTYDGISGNSIYDYVQDRNNLLFLGKLTNGVIIGAYSKQSFLTTDDDNQCFLFSIHPNNQFYKLTLKEERKTKKTVKLDKNFLIFGSNELRIKCQASSGYANIYGAASIFQCMDKKVSYEIFVMGNERSFEMTAYEVHELELQ